MRRVRSGTGQLVRAAGRGGARGWLRGWLRAWLRAWAWFTGRRVDPSRRRSANVRLGTRGEKLAARHLRRTGHRVLGRNLVLGGGELDLVAQHRRSGAVLVVEVKTTRTATGIRPEAHLDACCWMPTA